MRGCSICGEPGHYAPGCVLGQYLTETAEVRELVDALEAELAQYETIAAELARRIIVDRVRLADARTKLEALRAQRAIRAPQLHPMSDPR